SVVTTGPVAANQLCRDRNLADGRSWWGDLAEIIVYDRPLSDAERESVEHQLMAKYEIAPQAAMLGPTSERKPRFSIAQAHTSPITSLAFSPDGKMIASSSFDKTAKLWN